jgi:hypothetical protein
MKIFVLIIHAMIAGVLLLMLNPVMDMYYKIQSPESRWRDQSVGQVIVEDMIILALGVTSILALWAFYKNKRWAMIVLPGITFYLAARMSISAFRADAGLAAGPALLFGLILFAFFALETGYVSLKQWSKGT